MNRDEVSQILYQLWETDEGKQEACQVPLHKQEMRRGVQDTVHKEEEGKEMKKKR